MVVMPFAANAENVFKKMMHGVIDLTGDSDEDDSEVSFQMWTFYGDDSYDIYTTLRRPIPQRG